MDDGTGSLMIDPRGMEIRLPFLHYLEAGAISDYLHHFLIRRGIATDDLVGVEEFCIQPEDRLFVLGTLKESPWGQANRASTPTVLLSASVPAF